MTYAIKIPLNGRLVPALRISLFSVPGLDIVLRLLSRSRASKVSLYETPDHAELSHLLVDAETGGVLLAASRSLRLFQPRKQGVVLGSNVEMCLYDVGAISAFQSLTMIPYPLPFLKGKNTDENSDSRSDVVSAA
jgi:hypothetical protein